MSASNESLSPEIKPVGRWYLWLAWALPLAGYSALVWAIFSVATRAVSRPVALGLHLAALLFLLSGVVAIIVAFRQSRWHGWLGLAALLLGGPAIFLSVLLGTTPEARRPMVMQWREFRRSLAAAREHEGQVWPAIDVELPAFVLPDEPLFGEAQDADGLRYYPLNLAVPANYYGVWSANDEFLYLITRSPSEQLRQIRCRDRTIVHGVSLPSRSQLALSSAGPVVSFQRDGQHYLQLLDPADIRRAKQFAVPRYELLYVRPDSSLIALETPEDRLVRVLDLETQQLTKRLPKADFQESSIFGPEPSARSVALHTVNEILVYGGGEVYPKEVRPPQSDRGTHAIAHGIHPAGHRAIAHADYRFWWIEVFAPPE